MDIEKIQDGVIRFSNFLAVRLLSLSAMIAIATSVSNVSIEGEDVISVLPIVEESVNAYKATLDLLGIKQFAVYFATFMLISISHISYLMCCAIGRFIPPYIELIDAADVISLRRGDLSKALDNRDQRKETLEERLVELIGDLSSFWRKGAIQNIEYFSAMKFFVIYSFLCFVLSLFFSGSWIFLIGAFFSCLLLSWVLVTVIGAKEEGLIEHVDEDIIRQIKITTQGFKGSDEPEVVVELSSYDIPPLNWSLSRSDALDRLKVHGRFLYRSLPDVKSGGKET